MCCIGHVLSLLFMVVLCEGVLLVLSDSVEHPSASGWIPRYPPCGKPQGGGGVVVATRLRTLTGSVRSRAKQAICESISYHDTILGRVWEGEIGDMEIVTQSG